MLILLMHAHTLPSPRTFSSPALEFGYLGEMSARGQAQLWGVLEELHRAAHGALMLRHCP